MAKDSRIEWTHHTFNPWWGCAKVSPACRHCYAESWARRFGMGLWGKSVARRPMSDDYWRQPIKWNKEAARSGERRRWTGDGQRRWNGDGRGRHPGERVGQLHRTFLRISRLGQKTGPPTSGWAQPQKIRNTLTYVYRDCLLPKLASISFPPSRFWGRYHSNVGRESTG